MAKQFVCSMTEPVVQTPSGKIRGFIYDGIYSFLGIKYANAERFQMPTPVEPWEGVKDALGFGWTCPTLQEERCGPEIRIPHRYWPKNEACQYLNIWTQSVDPTKKRPVMLWIHGGGFAGCSSIELACTDGDALAKYGDVVMVHVNHRLNILGFLDVSAFGGEEYANSGNVGLADLVACLQWIHDNIACFGGDPDNVTIFGQSGGGGKVCALLQTPAANGLFHKAVVHSGIHVRRNRPNPEESKMLVNAMLEHLGMDFEQFTKIPYRDMADAFAAVAPGLAKEHPDVLGWAPLANGYYMGYARLDGFNPHALTVPTIVGTCYSEFITHPKLHLKHELTEEERIEIIRERYGDDTDAVVAAYRKAYPDHNILDLMVIDYNTRAGSLDHVIKRSRFEGAAPVYTYVFALDFPCDNGTPAWHCAELPYFFHNTDKIMVTQQEGVEKLEEEMAGMMVAFARYGNPNHPGMNYWPAYNEETKATMIFDRVSEARYDFDTELMTYTKKSAPSFAMPGLGGGPKKP